MDLWHIIVTYLALKKIDNLNSYLKSIASHKEEILWFRLLLVKKARVKQR